MKKSLSSITVKSSIFLLIIVFFSSCMGLGGGATNSETIEESGSPAGGGDVPGGGGGNIMPPISIAPKAVQQSYTVASAQDEHGITPVIGYAGAVDESQRDSSLYQIVVSDKEIGQEGARVTGHGVREEKNFFAKVFDKLSTYASNLFNNSSIISTAVADGQTDICSEPGVTCCDGAIQADGSFECAVPGDNTSTHLVYIMKKDTQELSDPISEPVNPNILYLRKEPKSVANLTPDTTFGIGYYGSVTEGLGAKISEVDGEFKVMNEWNSNYGDSGLQVTEGSTQIAADAVGNVTVKDDVLGVDVFGIDMQGGGDLNYVGRTQVPDTEKYNKLKLVGDNKVRFIRKPNMLLAVPDREKIYWGLDKDRDYIEYFSQADATAMGMTIKNTIAFDVENSGWALVLFEDDSDQLRFRLVNQSLPGLKRTNLTPLTITCNYDAQGLCNYKDLTIYKNASESDLSSVGDGKALLLDKEKNRVGVIDYNYLGNKIEPAGWVKLGSNKTPVAMALGEYNGKTTAFILNEGDSTVTVLRPFKADGTPKTVAEIESSQKIIKIKDLLGGKEMPVKLKDVAFTEANGVPHLMVSAEGLKSNLVVNLNTVTLTNPFDVALPNAQLSAPTKSTGATTTTTDDMLSIGMSEGM